jgi:hypothetical protein
LEWNDSGPLFVHLLVKSGTAAHIVGGKDSKGEKTRSDFIKCPRVQVWCSYIAENFNLVDVLHFDFCDY